MRLELIPFFAALSLVAGSARFDAQAQDNPFKDAKAVWHMGTMRPDADQLLGLKQNGHVQIGQKLKDDDFTQSQKRGGDGYVAVLDGGWLSLDDAKQVKALRPGGDAVSLCLRTWLGPNFSGTLFFSDFIALSVHPSGLAIGFLGVRTPHGKVFRELPLGILERGGWLDMVVRVGEGKLDFFCNGSKKSSVPINQHLCSPFDDALLIGAFMWSGPDAYGYHIQGCSNSRIDTVALWGRALSDDQIAFLSGSERVIVPNKQSPVDQAFQEYNAFFDASLNKDVLSCGKQWETLRNLADQDPWRPVYHLTQPLGHIYDPVGAYCYGKKYHVFSYRNIFALLRYSSLDHYVSDDLVHWTAWPIGPWADSDLDVYGIWLMNHFVDDKGLPRVLYTGLGTHGKHGILAQSSDGLVSYGNKKAVLTRYHHDGHVWKEGGTWYTITSKLYKDSRPGRLGDAVMLWSSPDLEKWEEKGEIFTQTKDKQADSWGDKTGFMEFPYLLSFGGKDVLMLGGYPVRYWVGTFDREQLKFVPDRSSGLLLDYTNPFHCFNPLCVDTRGSSGSSRRIVMALFRDLGGGGGSLLPWRGVHAMPRSLELDGDHLRQEPVPELQILRGAHYLKQGITLTPNASGFIDKRGDTVEIIAEFEPEDARCFGLKVRVSDSGASFVRIYFDTSTNEFGIDGNVPDKLKGCGPSYLPKGQPVRIHAFLDKVLVEAFVNGQTCTTAAQDRDSHCDGMDLFSEGGTARCTRLDIWDMKPAKAQSNHTRKEEK